MQLMIAPDRNGTTSDSASSLQVLKLGRHWDLSQILECLMFPHQEPKSQAARLREQSQCTAWEPTRGVAGMWLL